MVEIAWSKDDRCKVNYQKLRYRLLTQNLPIEQAIVE